MSRSDAYIRVMCNTCMQDSAPIRLTFLAGDGWDERNVTAALKNMGWHEDGEVAICEGCIEKGLDKEVSDA